MAIKQKNVCVKCGNKVIDYQESERKIDFELAIIVNVPFLTTSISLKSVLYFLKNRKKTYIEQCKECDSLQIKCPYCHNIANLDTIKADFICSHCDKKSYMLKKEKHILSYAINSIKSFIINVKETKKIKIGKDLIISVFFLFALGISSYFLILLLLDFFL